MSCFIASAIRAGDKVTYPLQNNITVTLYINLFKRSKNVPLFRVMDQVEERFGAMLHFLASRFFSIAYIEFYGYGFSDLFEVSIR